MGKDSRKGESKFTHKHHAAGQGHHHHHKLTIHGHYDEHGRPLPHTQEQLGSASEVAPTELANGNLPVSSNGATEPIAKDLTKKELVATNTDETPTKKTLEPIASQSPPVKTEQQLKDKAEIQMLREKYHSGSLPAEEENGLFNEASDKVSPLGEDNDEAIRMHNYNQQRKDNMSVSTFIHETLDHAQDDLEHDIGLLHLHDDDNESPENKPGTLSRNTYGLESDEDLDLEGLQQDLNHTQQSLYAMVLGEEDNKK